MNILDFNPHKSFISLTIFKLVFFGAITSSALITAIILKSSNIEIDWSYAGFNSAINIFKVPLGILAISIPVIALLAANHRSEQSREQMRLAQEQNNFSNYFKHLEELEKYCAEECKKGGHSVRKIRSLHTRLFPSALHGNYDLNEDSTSRLFVLADAFCNTYRQKDKEDTLTIYENDVRSLCKEIDRARDYFFIGNEQGAAIRPLAEGDPTPEATLIGKEAYSLASVLRSILEFSEGYTEPAIFKAMPERRYRPAEHVDIQHFANVAAEMYKTKFPGQERTKENTKARS